MQELTIRRIKMLLDLVQHVPDVDLPRVVYHHFGDGIIHRADISLFDVSIGISYTSNI